MQTFLIVLYLFIVVALVCVILLQPSEGGGLGNGGNSNFMTARGTANALTRLTSILAGFFIVLALVLFVMQALERNNSALDYVPQSGQPKSLLDQLGGAPQPSAQKKEVKSQPESEQIPRGVGSLK